MPLPASFNATYTCFIGPRRIATGPLGQVASEAKRAREREGDVAPLFFDNRTGRTVEVDTRGTDSEIAERLTSAEGTDLSWPAAELGDVDASASTGLSRGRGRPKLGVVAREVTLLPRHWEWLATQPGGASVALRKLVEQARRTHAQSDRIRQTQERTYYFISVLAGDHPGFEEASRALFANDLPKFAACMASWPPDWREHALWLASDHEGTIPG